MGAGSAQGSNSIFCRALVLSLGDLNENNVIWPKPQVQETSNVSWGSGHPQQKCWSWLNSVFPRPDTSKCERTYVMERSLKISKLPEPLWNSWRSCWSPRPYYLFLSSGLCHFTRDFSWSKCLVLRAEWKTEHWLTYHISTNQGSHSFVVKGTCPWQASYGTLCSVP